MTYVPSIHVHRNPSCAPNVNSFYDLHSWNAAAAATKYIIIHHLVLIVQEEDDVWMKTRRCPRLLVNG